MGIGWSQVYISIMTAQLMQLNTSPVTWRKAEEWKYRILLIFVVKEEQMFGGRVESVICQGLLP